MGMYRLCLRGPSGRIAKVRRYWANTDEGATAMARDILSDDPTLIALELWDGTRKIAEERRREGLGGGGAPRRATGHIESVVPPNWTNTGVFPIVHIVQR
jgi:hypothetical protein